MLPQHDAVRYFKMAGSLGAHLQSKGTANSLALWFPGSTTAVTCDQYSLVTLGTHFLTHILKHSQRDWVT